LTDERFKCPDSSEGGKWYITDPRAEQTAINKKNDTWAARMQPASIIYSLVQSANRQRNGKGGLSTAFA